MRADAPMRIGVDSESVALAASKGLAVSYGVFWVGSWTQKHGWAHAEQQMREAAARHVTPVVQWWYWGDDIGVDSLERGCQDARQHVWKDKTTWNHMATELADRIVRTMGERETIVIVETEFNKGGIETYDAFDGYLVDQIATFKRRGNIKTVVGFGNWGHSYWGRFGRAVAAADYLGVQLLRSSVRDASTYLGSIDTLIGGAEYLKATFNKPSLVTDLALSSYPSGSYETLQATVVEELFSRMRELKDAGVGGVMYRMLVDDPSFDTSNYHGIAERHWGLLHADKSPKPAFERFVEGLRRESHPAPLPPVPR